MQLQGSLACTDWGVFAPDSVNLNEHASIITNYITFCMDSTIPMKTVTVYPNSKPWITSDIKKNTLKKKQIAYRSKDIHTMKNAHRQLQTEISQAKQRYREKVENEFSCMNTKQAFAHLKKMSGRLDRLPVPSTTDPLKFASDLNLFYNRFDSHDFSIECQSLLAAGPLPGLY